MKRVVIKPYSKDRYEVAENYIYDDIVIPKGYKTNGADIPRIFWSIFPPNSPEYMSAVVVHDYMCDNDKLFSKEYADNVFKKALQELEVNPIKVWIFYNVVKYAHKLESALGLQCPYKERVGDVQCL